MSIKTAVIFKFLQMSKKQQLRDLNKGGSLDLARARKDMKLFNGFMKMFAPLRTDVEIKETSLDGLFCFHVKPTKKSKRVIYYLHGGAYFFGLVEQSSVYKYITAELAHAAQAETYALEYRITPDHHHPAALDDAYKGYLALLEKGISPKDIFVAGDSAGGGLTLALLMKLRDEDKPLPRAAIVLSPWADLTHSGESMITRADLDPIITKGAAVFMASLVLKGQSAKDPLISPLFGNYDGLPPLMILVGGREVLFDDSVRVSDKAKKAGVDVTLDIEENMIHVYPIFGGVFKEGRNAIDRIAAFIRKYSD